jgi:hypothetical protein
MIGYLSKSYDFDGILVSCISYGGKRLSNLYTYFRLDELNIAYSIGGWGPVETRLIACTDSEDYFERYFKDHTRNNKLRAIQSLKYYGVIKW